MPKVSILLPNLNNRAFVPERLESIARQTLEDWELVVVDGFSTDGAWEMIEEFAKDEPRARLTRLPAEGVYKAWNDCIERATGEYVYIATNDDSMREDCLEKLAAALDAHPECGIAHCCLMFVDENSKPVTDVTWNDWAPVRFLGELINVEHIRPRGYDAVVACALKTPYYSVTQIMVRQELFEKSGVFERRWGSYCDLEWQMRAALVTATVHVPEYLATWRMHPAQATQTAKYRQAKLDGWMVEIVDSAIAFSKRIGWPAGGLPRRLRRFANAERFHERWLGVDGRPEKMKFAAETAFSDPVGFYYLWRDRRRRWKEGETFKDVREELERIGIPFPTPTAKGLEDVSTGAR